MSYKKIQIPGAKKPARGKQAYQRKIWSGEPNSAEATPNDIAF